MTDFDLAYKFVRKLEGGKVDNPKDPGGRTAYGVTQRTYDEFRRRRDVIKRDVFLIDEEEIRDVYTQFWRSCGAHELPSPLGLIHFDSSFHSGLGNATRWLGCALWTSMAPHGAALAYLAARRAFLLKLDNKTFERGWLNRIDDLRKEAGI